MHTGSWNASKLNYSSQSTQLKLVLGRHATHVCGWKGHFNGRVYILRIIFLWKGTDRKASIETRSSRAKLISWWHGKLPISIPIRRKIILSAYAVTSFGTHIRVGSRQQLELEVWCLCHTQKTQGAPGSATCPLIFLQFTGKNNGGTASSVFRLARKCNSLTRTCQMNMRNATCMGHKFQMFRFEWPLGLFLNLSLSTTEQWNTRRESIRFVLGWILYYSDRTSAFRALYRVNKRNLLIFFNYGTIFTAIQECCLFCL